jgi:hypothetical protein
MSGDEAACGASGRLTKPASPASYLPFGRGHSSYVDERWKNRKPGEFRAQSGGSDVWTKSSASREDQFVSWSGNKALFRSAIAAQVAGSQIILWRALPIYQRLIERGKGWGGTKNFAMALALQVVCQPSSLRKSLNCKGTG